jgi:hypothetical protein
MRPSTLGSTRLFLLCCFGWSAATAPGFSAVTIGGPLRVGILYDNSGSMYPGYAPPGRPGARKADSGARFYYQYPDFQQWLADFVASQTLLDGATVSMSTFTSQAGFAPGDVQQVHPEVPIGGFDVARAVRNVPPAAGQTTYLTESLSRFTEGFEGLAWLITDNVVETRAGEINEDVRRFFTSLRDEPRYRSVHLFKYPFRDERSGQASTLAIYGILVSDEDVPKPVLAYYDRKLRSIFRFAERRGGDPPPPLFPGREHLKLKDLGIDALALEAAPNLEVVLDHPERLLEEGERLRLEMPGQIQSHLTQHAVTAGRYRLQLVGAFEPEAWAARELGAQPLAASLFLPSEGTIDDAIPPGGTREIEAILCSSAPIAFKVRSPLAWLRLAINGAVVKYTGRVRMSFDDVQVRLERAQMSGVFGIDQASSVFDFQEVSQLAVDPSETPVSFALVAGGSRTALLLVLLGLLAVVLATAAALLGRRRWYVIRMTGAPEKLVALRRLGRYPIVHDGQPLGTLSRGVSGDHEFLPSPPSAALTVTPAPVADAFDVRFREGQGLRLSIEPRDGGTPRDKREPRVVEAPSTKPPAADPAPLRALPKIDRP